ncbi:mitochondrial ribosome-associated GTPase 2 [Zootermopsis nevadensis]|uniref:mitochondrial ribosome-associated GTPase 2 n=1 Tax=Zootermopsis nevadensis TaxID=136037 RepID=UPI000B8EDC52|nr:mitochondrial ribosome-associated GTPase 2 [Zootermopsis nevadensis]
MLQYFVDMRTVRAIGGNGGDGAISFLQLWANETAGPDGGDGGHGGHVLFHATKDVRDLRHLTSVLRAPDGEKGYNKDCHGKSASHTVIQVPIGTIIKSSSGKVVGDLKDEGTTFVAARGGAGGHGNHFFVSDTHQAPNIAEYGAQGEELQYVLEVRTMAHIGLIGFPNAGKSTLLQAVSRARPKIAPYPFTTLKPHLGIIQYDDYDQIAVADLPGLIPGSHKNRGLGIQFLKHAERCAVLLFMLDLATPEPWTHLEVLQFELSQFSPELLQRPQLVVANKLDLPEAKVNLTHLQRQVKLPVIAISAKMGINLEKLLKVIKETYDKNIKTEDEE